MEKIKIKKIVKESFKNYKTQKILETESKFQWLTHWTNVKNRETIQEIIEKSLKK